MAEKIVVFVNDKPVEIFQGMQVKHALISLDYSLYKRAIDGEITVEDSSGFQVGLEGALHNGAKIYIRESRHL
jgi:hypothetical protein